MMGQAIAGQDQLPGLDSPRAVDVRALGWAVRLAASGQYQAAMVLPADQRHSGTGQTRIRSRARIS